MAHTPTNTGNGNLQLANDKMNSWFEEMIVTLMCDHVQLETNVASPEKRKMYETLASAKEADIIALGRNGSTAYFITAIVKDYIQELKENKIRLKRLAFDFNASKILVWAEIADDDEESINSLILAEAKVNANYSKYGFHISTTVVEISDDSPIPDHYKEVNINPPVGIV